METSSEFCFLADENEYPTLFLVCRNLPHSSPSMPAGTQVEDRCCGYVTDLIVRTVLL